MKRFDSAKWITDEHEEGSYDYKLKNLEEDDDKEKEHSK